MTKTRIKSQVTAMINSVFKLNLPSHTLEPQITLGFGDFKIKEYKSVTVLSCTTEFLRYLYFWFGRNLRSAQINRIMSTTGNLMDTLSPSKQISSTVLSGTGLYQELWLMFSQQNSPQPLPELRWNWK